VVVGRGEVVKAFEYVVQPARLLDGVQQEGRHDVEGHRRHDADGAEPQPGRLEQLGLLRPVALHD
jgi:hypothetical protein